MRGPLDTTQELLRVEMNHILGHCDKISKDPLWLRDARTTAPLEAEIGQ